MVGTFNQVILKDLTFDHVMFVFAAKIHRQSTSDNERGGKSWAGMILISCTFSKHVGLRACTCFCIYGRRDTKKMGSVLMFHSFVLEIQFHYFRKRSCVTK